MQRISKSAWPPSSSVPGLVTAILVVGVSAFVQARVLMAEPEIRHVVDAHVRQGGCIDTARTFHVDVVASRAKEGLQVVGAAHPQSRHPG